MSSKMTRSQSEKFADWVTVAMISDLSYHKARTQLWRHFTECFGNDAKLMLSVVSVEEFASIKGFLTAKQPLKERNNDAELAFTMILMRLFKDYSHLMQPGVKTLPMEEENPEKEELRLIERHVAPEEQPAQEE